MKDEFIAGEKLKSGTVVYRGNDGKLYRVDPAYTLADLNRDIHAIEDGVIALSDALIGFSKMSDGGEDE